MAQYRTVVETRWNCTMTCWKFWSISALKECVLLQLLGEDYIKFWRLQNFNLTLCLLAVTKNKIEFLLNILVFIQQRSREYKETYINKSCFLFKSKLNLQEMCVNLVHLELLVHHWKCILCHQSHYWPLVKHEHFFRGIKKLCSWVVVYYLCFQLSSSIIVDSRIKQNRNFV